MSNDLKARMSADTGDFKKGITEINRDIRLLESDFRASAAGLQDWTKDATGLENRIKTLNGQIVLQTQKVANTRAEYERLAAAHGAESKQAEEEKIKLNQATQVLNKMQLELHGTQTALKGMKDGTADADVKVKDTTKDMNIFKGVLNATKIGMVDLGKATKASFLGVGTMVKGEVQLITNVMKVSLVTMALFTAAIIGVGAAVTGLVFNSAATADQLGELSDKTGISVQRLQELDFIGKVVGTDLDTVTSSQAKLTRSIFAASQGTKAQKDAFAALGVKILDVNGHLRTQQDVFNDSIDALGRIQDPTLRDALAMQIFGKSAQELNPLIKAGKAGLLELTKQAHLLGAVMSDEDIAALGNFNDMLDGLKSGLQGVAGTIAATFLPGFTKLFTAAQGYLIDLVGVVRGSNGDLSKLAVGLSDLFTRIAQALARQLPGMTQIGLQIVQSVVNAIVGALPDIIPAASSILQTLLSFLVQNLPTFVDVGFQIIDDLVSALVTALPSLVGAGVDIIRTLLTSILAELPTMGPLALTILSSLLGGLISSLGLLNHFGPQIIIGLVDRIAAAAPMIFFAASEIIQGLVTGITTAVPKLLPAVISILKGLIGFLGTNLPLIAKAAILIIDQLLEAILPLLPSIVDAALQIVLALADGLTLALPTLTPVIVDVLLQIVELLLKNLPLIVDAALQIILALAQGLEQAIPIFIPEMPRIVHLMNDALIQAMPIIGEAVGTLIAIIIAGLIAEAPLLVPAVKSIVDDIQATIIGLAVGMFKAAYALVDGLATGMIQRWPSIMKDVQTLIDKIPSSVRTEISKLVSAGSDLVGGLWSGIKSRWAQMLKDFQDLVNLLPDAVKDALGIHSDSTVGMALGKHFSGGFGTGALRELENVRLQFKNALNGLGPMTFAGAAAGAGRSASNVQNSVNNDNFGFNNYGAVNFIGQPTPKSLATQIKAKRF